MSLPKEPRQKMINLMYLVLTALLALNVSAEILNAFKIVDSSLTSTNSTINQSTTTILASLDEKRSDPATAAKATIWYPKAIAAQAASKELNDYIQTLKNKILTAAGYNPAAGDTTYRMEDLDIATRIMVNEKEGQKLKQKLDDYKAKLLAIDPLIAQEFKKTLQVNTDMPAVQDKSNNTWELAYFHMVPTVASVTILSKFQNDVKTSENKVVAFCHEQVGKVQVRFDTYTAIVGQSSNYVMPGQEVEIMAGVGAFSKAAQPQIIINGQGVGLGEDGQAKLKMQGGSLGKHSIPVVIRFKDQDGKDQTINKTVEYTVGQASASIALDKMNVLYMGVPNPITVAASGGGDDRIQVSISGGGGKLEKTGAGKYNAFVYSPSDDCTITVSVDGKVAGASRFRVRTIPDPVATVGNYASGDNIAAGAFKAQAGVGAYVKDFPFELQYRVTSFTLTSDTDDGDIVEARCTGNTWSAQAQGVLKGLKAGKTVTIDEIRAQGPDGRNRKLPSLVYYIK
jgi:gliding motility-associated protein GldM